MTDVADPATDRLPRGSILGTRVLRSEDPAFLTRGAVHTDDLVDGRLTGAVRVTFVSTPAPPPRIVAVDAYAARAAPGVVAVPTAEDLAGTPPQQPMMPT